ncbi:MAG: hypothetical protein JXB32_14825 [Deltaproteobacteria bacterium]|nr:hypothetical protein [Deltaproteobacteria bacterium]
MKGTTIAVRLCICGVGDDDYGIAGIEVPAAGIDWSLADGPRNRITLADIYQVELTVLRPDEWPETDTWDRA